MAGELTDRTAGGTIEAAFHNAVKNRTVMRYASTAERASLIPSPAEGDVAYLEDTDDITYYDGATWQTLATEAVALLKAGGSMSGDLDINSNELLGLAGVGTTDFASASAGSIWSDNVSADGTLGNATIFSLVDASSRAFQIAIVKNGTRAWIRGIDGVSTDWGDWHELVTSGPTASAGIRIDTDTVSTNAVTTSGTIMLETTIAAGVDGYVFGEWMLTVKRTSAASVSDFNVLPREDGNNLSTEFRYGSDVTAIAKNVIPDADDVTIITGSFHSSVTGGDTSDYEIFVTADDNSRFQVVRGVLRTMFVPYDT